MKSFISLSQKTTIDFGAKLSQSLKGGDILLLYGDLGAGKTTLVKGIAAGLGIKKEITSPTFALLNLYKLKANKSKLEALVHIDTYRLKNEQELIDIGAEDYLGAPGTVCVIEWPEKIEGLLKSIRQRRIGLWPKKINIEHADEKKRKIIIKAGKA